MTKRLKSRGNGPKLNRGEPELPTMCNAVGDSGIYDLNRAAASMGSSESEMEMARSNYGDAPRLSEPELAYQNEREEPTPSKILKKAKNLHNVAEDLIYVDTLPLRFITDYKNVRTGEMAVHDRSYLKPLYDMCKDYPQGSRNQIWCTSRQCEKSTSMVGKSISLGVIYDAYKTLFISPRFDQVSVFSGQRFKPMAEDSPVLQDNFLDTARCLWQVGQREFTNRSFFNFKSCYATADGSRGITANHLAIDEIQDIISDNIPVLEECQSHYGWDTGLRTRTYAGTPKSLNNTITKRYNESAQFEMLTKCQACNHWNYADEKIIGLHYYICTKCGKEIFPKLHGQWIPMKPEMLEKCWGFRITQIAVPFKTHADIKEKMDDPLVSQAKFYNECLGLPYDSGEMVLTDSALRQACDDRSMIDPPQVKLLSRNGQHKIFAGLDHGSGEGDSPSYTALALGWFNPSGKFDILFVKKFYGKDASLSTQPELIDKLCQEAGVLGMMADWGFGAHQNARLVDEFGWSWDIGEKVLMQCQYVNSRAFSTFDEASYRYHIDRTASMERTITAIKNGQLRFFSWNDFSRRPDVFKDDFTSIFIEYNETTGRSKFDHIDNDDCFHAVSYCYMAALQFAGKLNTVSTVDANIFLQPGQEEYEYNPDDEGW